MTITIEHLSDAVSKALQARARLEGKSVPDVAAEILSNSLTPIPSHGPFIRDLTGIAGSMSEEDARAIEDTVRWMDEGDLAKRA